MHEKPEKPIQFGLRSLFGITAVVAAGLGLLPWVWDSVLPLTVVVVVPCLIVLGAFVGEKIRNGRIEMDEKPRNRTRLVIATAILVSLIFGGVGVYAIKDYRAALERVEAANRRPRQMNDQQRENLERQLGNNIQFTDELRRRPDTPSKPSIRRAGPVPEEVDRGMLFDAIRQRSTPFVPLDEEPVRPPQN
jgi:hypothetical protein